MISEKKWSVPRLLHQCENWFLINRRLSKIQEATNELVTTERYDLPCFGKEYAYVMIQKIYST
jgi:hypothetical protein